MKFRSQQSLQDLRHKICHLDRHQRNMRVKVDNLDFEYLNQFKWCAYWSPKVKNFYTIRNLRISKNKRITQYMHHLVVGVISLPRILKLVTDHKDGNTLNNVRKNLQIVEVRK